MEAAVICRWLTFGLGVLTCSTSTLNPAAAGQTEVYEEMLWDYLTPDKSHCPSATPNRTMATWVHPTILMLNPLLINEIWSTLNNELGKHILVAIAAPPKYGTVRALRSNGIIYYLSVGIHSSGTSETLNLRFLYLCLKHSMNLHQLIVPLLLPARTVNSSLSGLHLLPLYYISFYYVCLTWG